jgi:GTP cyclohydrolase IA
VATRSKRTAGKAKRAPDRAALERAVRDFLEASGADLEDPNVQQTPERVAAAWLDEFLDGYRTTPEAALGERFPAPKDASGELVIVTGLRYRSVCPHHLLPYEGVAHIAYAPRKEVVGFGRLSTLLDCHAHRLILQEDLARAVARSLREVLGSPATACVLEAQMTCLQLRGENQQHARTHAEAYEGTLRKDGPLRRELWARLAAALGPALRGAQIEPAIATRNV